MDLVLCHTTADFDTLGAAVGLTCLQPGARIVLAGGAHPAVQNFLALYRDEYPLVERRSVDPTQIHSLKIVDTQQRDRLGSLAEWLDQPQVEIVIYDHHLEAEADIPAIKTYVEAVGAATTLVVEQLQAQQIALTVAEATVMALGIHADTGSLTFGETTVRDATALAWLMAQGSSLSAIAQYTEPGLSQPLQELLTVALEQLQTEMVQGSSIAWVLLTTESYTPGLSQIAAYLMTLTDSDSLLLANAYSSQLAQHKRLTIIGRAKIAGIDLNTLLQPLGGGGHPRAAAVTLKTTEPQAILNDLIGQLKQQIPPPPTAELLMAAPVRTIRPETTIDQARLILLRYGHSGLPVVDAAGQLAGIVTRRDLEIALHHGFGHAPVKGYMTHPVKTITSQTLLPEIESLMVTYDIGRLPVLVQEQLVGIVTRTDVLRQLHQLKQSPQELRSHVTETPIKERLQARLSSPLQQLLVDAAEQAKIRGWQLYLVGGAVRDLLLAEETDCVQFHEFDLVVDGVQPQATEGAGVELAGALQQIYPQVQLQVYGKFQTAALRWPHQSPVGAFAVDIATARTEFYPYPAANPEVEASSIRQDLYRRDFSINALAVRLTSAPAGRSSQPEVPSSTIQPAGELLDFFGGIRDLQQKLIRVLHPNSFIEDPTRIFRAVRFAVRLGFQLDLQTERLIRHAIASGIYHQIQEQVQAGHNQAPALQARLKNELKYILRMSSWETALKHLADLGAFQCLHPALESTPALWRKLHLGERWWQHLASDHRMSISRWELLLEILLIQLSPQYRVKVAENLHLSPGTVQRLQQLDQIQTQVVSSLGKYHRPSEISQLLSPHNLATLILLAAQSSLDVRRSIWLYLTHWSHMKPLLSGSDLQALGYQPGRQFKQILSHLRAATLDGIIPDRSAAIAFLNQNYPLTKSS